MGFFSPSREIRLENPLSPFLFPVVAYVFSQILKNVEKCDLIQGFCVGKEAIPISHLHYADDILLFLDGGKNHHINLISLIPCFELVSRMKIN